MTYQQLVTPTPNIPCVPGWCLQYVRQTFGAPVVEPTATAGWNNAKYKHTDYDFPADCWVPLWFSLATEPAGHVVLRAPNGKIYSTTNPYQYTPRVHPNLADLISAYAPYNPLTYLGWTEDISGVRVVQEFTLETESITQEDDMPSLEEIARAVWSYKNADLDARDMRQIVADIPGDTLTKQFPHKDPITGKDDGQTTSLSTMGGFFDYQAVQTRLAYASPQQIVNVIPKEVAAEVVKLLTERLAA